MHVVTIPQCNTFNTEDTRPRWFTNAQRRCQRLAGGGPEDWQWTWAWNRSIPHKVRVRDGSIHVHFERESEMTMFMFSPWCQEDGYELL